MVSRIVIGLAIVFSFLFVASSFAITEQFDVGTGQNSAGLYIEWNDGYIAQFLVRFDNSSVTGLNLFDIVEASTGLTTAREYYGSLVFIDGINFNGHSNSGYGGGADWWHYWIKDSEQTNWMSPAFGASDRVVYDGDDDGWIYGRDGAVPEPASIVLFGFGGLILRRRRKQYGIS
jgi:hypothetical protein